MLATLVGLLFIDRWGRRPLLLEGGVQMLLSQVRALQAHLFLGWWSKRGAALLRVAGFAVSRH